ncbi:hypothetical protein ACYSNX_03020 [Myroides sp. LJL115]
MKKGIFLTLLIVLFCLTAFSCQQKDNSQQKLNESVMQHNDSVFAFLETNWHFQVKQNSQELQTILDDWKIWQEFAQELAIKPVTSIGAYQNKIKVLDNKLSSLSYLKYPEALDTPDIKARVTVLSTSIKNLNMFLQLNPIDIDKVQQSLDQVNENLDILLSQMQNNLSKPTLNANSAVDFQQLLDTVRRANPTN